MDLIGKTKAFFELIKFEHSIFALPFAYLGLFFAEGRFPRPHLLFWVTIAMVAIRTAGMCLNRLIDQELDEQNPRTRGRIPLIEILKRPRLWMIAIGSIAIFIFSAAQLNSICFFLSPVPVLLVWVYPYSKRITWCSHFLLGMILGLAPYAGWLAGRGHWSLIPLLLTLAVMSWVSGFDMFYALQDLEFDQAHQLYSYPARYGVKRTILSVSVLHSITIFALALLGWVVALGFWYWIGWTIVVALIVREHGLVHRFGLGKIDEAFFNMNALVSVVIFLAAALQLTVHPIYFR